MPTTREIREQLLARDSEFQRLRQEHSRYEAQLQQLSDAPYVNAENIVLEADLKKLKLRVKDEMERRVALVCNSSETH